MDVPAFFKIGISVKNVWPGAGKQQIGERKCIF